MTVQVVDRPTRSRRRSAALTIGLLVGVFPLAACGNDDAGSAPEPTTVSIAPSSASPTSQAPPSSASPTASSTASKPMTEPSIAQSEKVRDIAGAVAVAESAVENGTVVEVSDDDDNGTVVWEATVRSGDRGRELRIGTDGSVLSSRDDRLDQSQLGDLPKVTVLDAITTGEKRVDGGVVTGAELSEEKGQRVWDLSVDVAGSEEWELWVDATSGKVVHEERD